MLILAGVFLSGIWLPGMTAALAGSGCLNPSSRPDATRLRLCDTALTVGRFTIFATEPRKTSALVMARAILHANMGQSDRAADGMRQALDLATGREPRRGLVLRAAPAESPLRKANASMLHWTDRLFQIAAAPNASPRARSLWAAIVAETVADG